MTINPPSTSRIWQPEAECLSRDELTLLQQQRLRDVVSRCSNVPFYASAFKKAGIKPSDIKSISDLQRLPFTNKSDLRDHYPLGFLAVPREEIVRYHGSSGTTGKPTFVAYTRRDIETWSDLVARFLVAGGTLASHTAQIAFGYGLFTGGFGLHYGLERIGVGVIPAAGGNTERQLMLMQDLQTDILICTPSYALRLAEILANSDIPRESLALKFAHLGGEPWTEDMRIRIESSLQIKAFNNYGLSEVIGPGVSGECMHRTGMHIAEDHFIVECLDPETLEPVPDGTPGELAFTALTKEAFPIIRYRTRDIATLDHSPCPCSRTSVRMSRVTGRTDDMLIIRGVNVFPSQIEEALLRVEGTAPHYQIVVERPGTLDEVTVRVEVIPEIFSDSMSDMQAIHSRISQAIHTITGLHATIELVDPQTLERFDGKATRVIDNRKILQS